MGILLIFAFVSGLVTILTPCIWPLLPILLSSTATGGHRKPLGIVIGIMTSFAIFTLTISYIVKVIPFDPNSLRLVAVIVIGFLGLTLIVPPISRLIEGYISRLSGKVGSKLYGKQQNGLIGGLITGLVLGLVWSPCAGPILATVATLAATSNLNFGIILVTVVYIIGIGIPLFLFTTFGRIIFTKSRSISKYTGRIQQVFGVIMILTAIAIYTNFDKTLQTKILTAFPKLDFLSNSFEKNAQVTNELNKLKGQSSSPISINQNDLFNTNSPAPEFVGINNWINSKPLTMQELRGKVVLVDFWTYTCINCIRTLPHVTSWFDKYNKSGFVIIGVHTPEFEFEKNKNNVLSAIKQYNIHYPVAQDNNYSTWNAYSNQYWPAEYLIDVNGNVRRIHFGEGEYDLTEKAIKTLLKEAGKKIDASILTMPDDTPSDKLSPETYLGAKRMQYYFPDGNVGAGKNNFKLGNPPVNSFSLGGEWEINEDNALTIKNGILNYNFSAKKVFLVLRPGTKNSKAKIYLDGKLIQKENAGSDVKNGEIIIDQDRLYSLVNLKNGTGNHLLRIEFEGEGIEVFAFTFG